MADQNDAESRLAQIYDVLYPDRSDLDVYAAMAREFGAGSVLDIGCGTGTFACLLAARGLTVTGVDPSAASLAVARAKPHADQVRWVHGHAQDVFPITVDLATMTANVAQEISAEADWDAALRAAYAALRPGGRLIFETRDPAQEAWLTWNRHDSYQRLVIDGVGELETWYDIVDVTDDLVTFSGTYIFADGVRLTPVSSLRFRSVPQVSASLAAAGFEVDEIRDAPDRPGREVVFIARKP